MDKAGKLRQFIYSRVCYLHTNNGCTAYVCQQRHLKKVCLSLIPVCNSLQIKLQLLILYALLKYICKESY